MSYSVTPPKSSFARSSNNVTYLPRRPRAVDTEYGSFRTVPFDGGWTEELERRRLAVARWRGSDVALKETMMRTSRWT